MEQSHGGAPVSRFAGAGAGASRGPLSPITGPVCLKGRFLPMRIRKYDFDYSRRHFMKQTAAGILGAGVFGSVW
ncbi:MAG: twin-arginine translocation signal domain-containing protein, partial [Gammaproteobacteria bacterium]